MKTDNLKQAIPDRPVVLYRRVSTKKQLKQEYKNQLDSVKAVCPQFRLSRANNIDLKEAISGYSSIERRMATKLGTALRHLKHSPRMIMLVSSADRIARRADVFEKIQTQGLGHRIFDVSSGKTLEEIINTGEHHRIEAQYKAQLIACHNGIAKRIAAGGSMGNPKIRAHKKKAAKAKKLNDKERKDAVLAVVARQSMSSRGKPPCLMKISDTLDRMEVRTGQSRFFTPTRLRQFKKNNPIGWQVAETRYQRRMHRTKQIVQFYQIEIANRFRSKRRRARLDELIRNSMPSIYAYENDLHWCIGAWSPFRHMKAGLFFENSCRGPPEDC